MNSIKTIRNERGFSIVSILAALAILGILAAMFSGMFSSQITMRKKIERLDDLENLRNMIRIGTDCTNTTSGWAATCTANLDIPIKRSGTAPGADLIAKKVSGNAITKIGDFYVAATCTGTARNYIVKYGTTDTAVTTNLFSVTTTCP